MYRQLDWGLWRPRLLVGVSILCGSAAAAIFWQSQHRVAPGISEERARLAGFSSASQFNATLENAGRLYQHQSHGGWNERDWQVFADSLVSTQEPIRQTIQIQASVLHHGEQRRRALSLLNSQQLSTSDREVWSYVVRQWLADKKNDPGVQAELLACSNPQIVDLVKQEVLDLGNVKSSKTD